MRSPYEQARPPEPPPTSPLAPEPAADRLAEPSPPPGAEEGPVSLNDATYDDLRNLELSVTQAGRVLAYRERAGGFRSLDELDRIPGLPRSFLDQLKGRLTL